MSCASLHWKIGTRVYIELSDQVAMAICADKMGRLVKAMDGTSDAPRLQITGEAWESPQCVLPLWVFSHSEKTWTTCICFCAVGGAGGVAPRVGQRLRHETTFRGWGEVIYLKRAIRGAEGDAS